MLDQLPVERDGLCAGEGWNSGAPMLLFSVDCISVVFCESLVLFSRVFFIYFVGEKYIFSFLDFLIRQKPGCV